MVAPAGQNPENWKTVQEEIAKLSKDPSQRELYRILQMQFKDTDGRGNSSKGEGSKGATDSKDNPDCIVELLKGGKRPLGGATKTDDSNSGSGSGEDVKNGAAKKEDASHGSPKSIDGASQPASSPSAGMSASVNQSSALSSGSRTSSPYSTKSNSPKPSAPVTARASAASSPGSVSATSTVIPSSKAQQQPAADGIKTNIPPQTDDRDTAAPTRKISEIRAPKKKFLEAHRSRSSSFTSGDTRRSGAGTFSGTEQAKDKPATSSDPSNAASSSSAPVAEKKTAAEKSQGQYLNIRTCIERIMESELLRKTLQEDTTDSVTSRLQHQEQQQLQQQRQQQQQLQQQQLQHVQQQLQAHDSEARAPPTGAPRPQRREELHVDEDSNMPLLPHDIQKQIKSVYTTDIEQEKKSEKVLQHLNHMHAMKEMYMRTATVDTSRGQVPVSSPASSHMPTIHPSSVQMSEGTLRPGVPPHFRPYPARLPHPAGVEHLVTLPYPVSAANMATFPAPKISQQQARPELVHVVGSKPHEPPAMGVIRPMMSTFRPGTQGGEEGLQNYPIFPPMGMRYPGPHLGMPMVPPGGIIAGRPPMPIPAMLPEHQRYQLPVGMNHNHMPGPVTSATPIAQVAPHGMMGLRQGFYPMQHVPGAVAVPVTHQVAAPPKVPNTQVVTQHIPLSVSPAPHKDPLREDTAIVHRTPKGAIPENMPPLLKEEYHYPFRPSPSLVPRENREIIKARSPVSVPPADSQDEPLDLSVKKPIQHCSTHILSLQETMRRHMDGITTQPYDHQVLVQTAAQVSPHTLPGRAPSVPHLIPAGVVHATTVTSPTAVSPLMHRESFSSTGQTPVVAAEATRFDRRGSYDSNTSHGDSSSFGLDARSPSPASRASIASILGDHPPNDILFLKCSQCTSTYGSLHSFKKHFSKAHGREPTKDDVTIQSISATRSALEKDLNSVERQDALRSLNLLPSNKYYESQIARYKTTDYEGEGHPGEFILKSEEELLLESKLSKSPSTPDEDDLTCETSPASEEDKFEEAIKIKSEAGEQNTMKCLQCGQEFPTRDWGVFRRHVRAHENPCEGQFRCSVCRQGFREEYQWRHHMSTSHMMQSCRCRKCNIAFTHVGDLNKHLQTSHRGGQSGDVEYKCLYCIKTFLSPNDLLLHTQDHERKFEYQSRNKQGKPVPAIGRQDKGLSSSPLCLPIVRKATPDTTYSEDKKSPEGAAKDKEKRYLFADQMLLQSFDPKSGDPESLTLAVPGTDSELEQIKAQSNQSKVGYVQRSSSAPELQHSDASHANHASHATSKLADRSPAQQREYVDMYDIIRMKMEVEHKMGRSPVGPPSDAANSGKSAEKPGETTTMSKKGYSRNPQEVAQQQAFYPRHQVAPHPGSSALLKEGMHRLPAQVLQPQRRHTPEPRYSRSPVPPPRAQEAKQANHHLPEPFNPQHSQLPLLQSALHIDANEAPGLRQYRVSESRQSPLRRATPEPRRSDSPRAQHSASSAQPFTDDRQRYSPNYRPQVAPLVQHPEKPVHSHLQQHLLGVGAPFRKEVISDLQRSSPSRTFTQTTRGLEALADAAANSKPVPVRDDSKNSQDKSTGGHEGKHPQMMSYPAARVILTGGPSPAEEEDRETMGLKRSNESDSSLNETGKRLMFKNARTVLDEIVENALTQHQEDDSCDHVPFVQSKILQTLALDAQAMSFGRTPSIQQRQRVVNSFAPTDDTDRTDRETRRDSHDSQPVSPPKVDKQLPAEATNNGTDSRVVRPPSLVTGPSAISRPGNVRDIIESLVTHELMNSNDLDKSKDDDDDEDNTHVLSQAIRKLYGLPKQGVPPGGPAADDAESRKPKPIVVAKITESESLKIATLVSLEEGDPTNQLRDSDSSSSWNSESQDKSLTVSDREKKTSSPMNAPSNHPATSISNALPHLPVPHISRPPPSQDGAKTAAPLTNQTQSSSPYHHSNTSNQSQSRDSNTLHSNTSVNSPSQAERPEPFVESVLKRKLPSDTKLMEKEIDVEIKRPRST